MSKKMLIDATHAEETRVVVVDGTKVEEFDFETVNKRQLAGNIYLAKVTRVEPSLQAAFVDYGGNRHGFLAFAEIHPDYYQIPAVDRKALLEEERQAAADENDEADKPKRNNGRRRNNRGPKPAAAETGDVKVSEDIAGMAVVDLSDDEGSAAEPIGHDDRAEHAAHDHADAQGADDRNADDRNADDRGADDQGAADARDDDGIESVAEEDVAEEISAPKKYRARRYKIQEVVKVRQILLVQVVKEERGNKGAALTTYLSLAGRYCVLMPNTARGGGISRKITVAADRKKLKEIASELEVPEGAGLIIRTAGSQRTRTEIRRDYEYLMRLWEQIRELTFKSIAPAPVYEEGDLIKRTIRDIYSKEIDEVLVEGERGYRTAKDFMKMIMPSHAKNVKHYVDQMPLFARFQVESYLGGMFNPVVQLKSGGYIVIGVTEALVAIDVNSGRATKEGSIEDTATKTNLEAADEVARQLRLRDLAGLIVIDFIDMEERKNNAAVEKRFKDKLKTDRARIQVGRISGFGLMEMSRQRLRPGMLESTTQPCAHCHGTGLIRSDDSLALTILRAVEDEGTRKRSLEVLVKAPTAVANFLMNAKREHVGGIEARYGMSVRVEADPTLISPDYIIEKFKTATRNVPEVVSPVVSVNALLMAQIDESHVDDEIEDDEPEAAEADNAVAEVAAVDATSDEGEGQGNGKRRRRRRRRGGKNGDEAGGEDAGAEAVQAGAVQAGADAEAQADQSGDAKAAAPSDAGADAPADDAKPRRRSRSRRRKSDDAVADAPAATDADAPVAEVTQSSDLAPEPAVEPAVEMAAQPQAPLAASDTVSDTAAETVPTQPEVPSEARSEPVRDTLADLPPAAEPVSEPVPVQTPEPEQAAYVAPEPQPAPQPQPEPALTAEDEASRPKRRGWWSLG